MIKNKLLFSFLSFLFFFSFFLNSCGFKKDYYSMNLKDNYNIQKTKEIEIKDKNLEENLKDIYILEKINNCGIYILYIKNDLLNIKEIKKLFNFKSDNNKYYLYNYEIYYQNYIFNLIDSIENNNDNLYKCMKNIINEKEKN